MATDERNNQGTNSFIRRRLSSQRSINGSTHDLWEAYKISLEGESEDADTTTEIVDPSTVLPIPGEGAEDGGTRLSEKTRRRLKDLGITELFAGAL